MIKKYRPKQVEFEAIQLEHDMSNWREVCEFIGDDMSQYEGEEYKENPEFLYIPMCQEAYGGEYVIALANRDTFQVMNESLFEEQYEEVEPCCASIIICDTEQTQEKIMNQIRPKQKP